MVRRILSDSQWACVASLLRSFVNRINELKSHEFRNQDTSLAQGQQYTLKQSHVETV